LLPKRATQDDDFSASGDQCPDLNAEILAAETLRNSANSSEVQLHSPSGDGGKANDDKVPVLWRVLGGTILSITALVVISAYQSLTGTLKDLNGEINQLRESKADFVKKDEYADTRKRVWEQFQKDQSANGAQFQTINAALGAMKGDWTVQDKLIKDDLARLTGSIKSLQDDKREILTTTQAAVGQVREHQATFEQQLRSVEQTLKSVEQQLRSVEQCAKDIQATNVTVSALQAASTSREVQLKQAEEHRAELSKAVAEMRERLVKLEVAIQNKPPAKPAVKTTAQKVEEDPDGP